MSNLKNDFRQGADGSYNRVQTDLEDYPEEEDENKSSVLLRRWGKGRDGGFGFVGDAIAERTKDDKKGKNENEGEEMNGGKQFSFR